MKKLIRKGVFETNSSSCHSLSIEKSDTTTVLDTIYPNEEGNVVLEGGEFGWEVEVYNDAYTKANYVAVMILLLQSSKEDFKTREDKSVFKYYTLPEFADENYEICKSNFEEVIKEQTGCNEIIYNCTQDYSSKYGKIWSYIDHQSFEDASDAKWLLNKEQIKDFIFNPKSTLHTDNDNH